MTEQGYPPRQPEYPDRPGRRGGGRESRRSGWQVLDDFDSAADTDSDLPPWAVPGGIAPNRAARRSPRRPPERSADDRDWPGDRAFGRPATARHGTTQPGPAQSRLAQPAPPQPRPGQSRLAQPEPAQSRLAQPGPAQSRLAQPRSAQSRLAQPRSAGRGPDPYGDPRDYEEPPGYSRPPGYDEPRGYRDRGYDRTGPDQARGRDEYGEHEHPRGYDEPDEYDEPEQYHAPGRRSRPGVRDDEGDQAPARRLRLPGRSRAAAARRRRSKRRLLTWGGTALVIAALVAGGLYLTRSPAKNVPHYVRALQKGEFRGVPSACKVLSATTLHQVMAGTPATQPVGGGQGQSECTFTVDVKPAFRILQIQEQAYQPSVAVPTGNGSATANAAWNFSQSKLQLAKPPKHSVWPAARFAPLGGLGDQAVSAVQASRGHVVTDRVIVLVRYRNVMIQVQAQAQENGGFGPVPVADLRSAALTAARSTFAAIQKEPTA